MDDSIDLGAIALSHSRSELKKFLELIIYSVIRCPDKEKFIGRILQLSQQCQSELMVFIETVLAKFERKRASIAAEPDEVLKLTQLNAQLKRDVENLTQELTETRNREHDLMRQLEEFNLEMARNVRKPHSIRPDLEGQLAEKSINLLAVSKRLEEVEKSHAVEIATLKDELDIANERLAQTVRLENALEKYKRRAEETTVAKGKLKEIETYNRALQDKLQTLEEERVTVTQLQHSLSIYKEQLAQEKERSAALSLTLQSRDRELTDLHHERIHLQERQQTYESRLQRLTDELDKLKNTDQSDDSISLRGTYGPVEMEEMLKSLESENKRLQLMIGNEELVKHFNEQIDSALLAKKQVEERLKQTGMELNTAKTVAEELQLRNNSLQTSISLNQSKIAELEEKIRRFEAESEKYDAIFQENERLKAEKEGFMTEIKTIYREKDALQQKLMQERDENRKIRDEIASKPSSSVLKQLETERNNLILSVENSNLKLSLRERDDKVRNLASQLSDMETNLRKGLEEQRKLMEGQRGEEVERLQGRLREREREMEELTKASNAMKALWYKEEKLMVGVMHEIGVEVFRQRGRKEPTHLAQQREKVVRP